MKHELHGHTKGGKRSPTQQVYTNMIMRCTNRNRPDYKYYGGRGIKVCKRWLRSFAAFLSDMGERPEGKTLDRKKNDKGYSKSNCRWATRFEQMQNTRTNRKFTLDGVSMTMSAWARKIGITHSSIDGRIKLGWTLRKTLTQPGRGK